MEGAGRLVRKLRGSTLCGDESLGTRLLTSVPDKDLFSCSDVLQSVEVAVVVARAGTGPNVLRSMEVVTHLVRRGLLRVDEARVGVGQHPESWYDALHVRGLALGCTHNRERDKAPLRIHRFGCTTLSTGGRKTRTYQELWKDPNNTS
jgi:hypothetical protein